MNFNFGEVLTRAWQITWKYKVLWIFGILAGCTRGGGGSGGGGSGSGSGNNPFTSNPQNTLDQMYSWLSSHVLVIVAVVIFVIVLWVLFIFLGTIGQIGLIRGTLQAEGGAASLSFGTLFTESLPFFWRVFGLSFFVGLIVLIIFIPLILVGIVTGGVGFLCILPLICILIPVMWVVSMILEQADVAIVKENLRMLDGLRRGWEILRNNVGPVLIMGLIMLVISIVIGLIIAIPIFVIVFPAMFAMFAGQGQNMTPLLVAGLCFVAYIPVALLVRGVLTTFTESAWTLTYLRLTSPSQPDNSPILVDASA